LLRIYAELFFAQTAAFELAGKRPEFRGQKVVAI